MSSNRFFCNIVETFTCLSIVLLVSTVTANEAKKSNAFDDFLTLYGRHNSLEINDINDITRNLLNKFSCLNYGNTDCYNVKERVMLNYAAN